MTEEQPAQDNGSVETGGGNASPDVANDLLRNPGVLASLQDRLPYDGKLHAVAHYQSLPKPVKRRVKALKKLQFDTIKLEAAFYKEQHELEMKYAAQYVPFYDRRREILTGRVEPTDEDCDWPSDEEGLDDSTAALAATLRDRAQIDAPQAGDGAGPENAVSSNGGADGQQVVPLGEASAGVDDFWLVVLKNVDIVAEMIQEHDEPILKHLQDIRVHLLDGEEAGYKLEFHFSPNDFFSNAVLTKQYFLSMEPEQDAPFTFDGPEIVRCRGCEIHWKKGKNVTVKVVRKVQKHKGRGEKRTVTKTVHNDSFFNFFAAAEQSLDELNEDDEDAEQLLHADFEIAHFLRERVIPRAVLYFTGEALDEEDDFEEEEDDDEDDDEDDSDQDEDIEATGRRSGANRGSGTHAANTDQKCNQQ